jgi:hypothetical protein
MQDIMERRAAKDFMITQLRVNTKRIFALFAGPIFLIGSCSPDLSDSPIPFVPFDDISINLTLPAYSNLLSDGGTVYVDGGVRGIILHRINSSTYMAFERNCSFQPEDACATVDAQTLDMKDSCCGSIFSYADGRPTSGPAWRPLQQYQASLSGNTLTITDTVVE